MKSFLFYYEPSFTINFNTSYKSNIYTLSAVRQDIVINDKISSLSTKKFNFNVLRM